MAEVKFKFVGDDSELRKKLADLAKLRAEMSDKFAKDFASSMTSGLSKTMDETAKQFSKVTKEADLLNKVSNNSTNAQGKLRQIEAIAQLRIELQKEREEQKLLKKLYDEGKISLEQYRKEVGKFIKSEQERSKAIREGKKQLSENGEYQKLNRALANVRKESKDLLAEMFRMERQGYKNTLGYEKLREKADALTKQTQFLDKGIKKIDASLGLHQRNVGNYTDAVENVIPVVARVNSQLSAFGLTLDDLAKKPGALKELGAAFVGMGKNILTFLTSPIGALLAGLGTLFALFQSNKQTVIDFDSGMKNVGKTTGLAGKELSLFGNAIVELSAKLQVVSADKLLEYATVAGQLGVKGRADILAFSEALAMLETASDITGEEGGSSIARMLTLVDGGVQNVKAFGDEIVNLGNNFAATEKEILDNATQISQNVGIYRIGRQEVLAFATATKAVGLEAELVGSTFSRTLGEFEKTLRTGKGVSDLLKVIGGNQADLQKKFREDASGVFVDYVKGLNNIHKAGGSVNEALEHTGVIAVRDQRVISSLATNGFDVLTGALENVKEAHGAMQTEFENGASKLEQQSKRMSIAWDNFVLTIEKGEGVIAGVFLRLMDGASILLDTITKAFNPTSFGEFTTRLFDLNAADKIRGINLAMAEGEGTVKKLGGFDLSKSSQKQINDLTKETESSLKSVTSALKIYNEEVEKGKLKDGGKNSIASVEGTKRALEANLGRLKIFYKEEQAVNTKIEFEESEADNKKAEREKAAADRQIEQGRQAVERQRSLQAQIDSIAEQASRKQLSRDQEEIESIKDKYSKIREEIRKFLADPKNKGQKVDQGKLVSAERFEINEAETRQSTNALLKQLNEQRAIYTEFHSYVEQNGIDAAKKMFGTQSELAEEYREKLKKEYLAITALQTTASLAPFTGINVKLTQAQEERAKALKEMLDALDKEDQTKSRERYAKALQLAQTFGQQEYAIRKKYAEAVKELGDEASKEQTDALKRVLQSDLESLINSSPQFKKAMEDIEKSTQVMLGTAFQTGKDSIFKLIDGMEKATDEEKARLKKLFGEFFDKGAKDAELGNLDNIARVANEFGNLVESALTFSTELDGGLKSLSAMVGVASQVANSLSSIFTNKKLSETFQTIGAALPIVGAVIGIGSSISSLFNKQREQRNEEQQAEILAANDRQLKATEAMTLALQMQLEIINDLYGTERLNEYESKLTEISKTYSDLSNQLSGRFMLTNDNFTNSILERLNNGESQKQIQRSFSVASKEYYQVVRIFKDLNKYSKLPELPKDIKKAREELIKLQSQIAISGGGIDDNTQRMLDQLEQQIELYEETLRKGAEERTGNAFSSLLSDVTSLFLNEGMDAGKAWSDGFNKVMENYMIQKFSREFLQEKMKGWYDLLDDFSEDGITASERDQLNNEWNKLKEEGEKRLNDIKDILGLSNSEASSDLKSETIARQISENTGSELVGLFRSTYDLNKQQLLAIQANGKTQVDLIAIANDKLVALNAIQVNTFNTANEALKISNNTAESLTYLRNIDKSLGGANI
ncbi:phage tail tape measure protein [Sphingobacterium cellulitidis]|uniref:phage tail tape measure protein n=1 Tax=Sphingobacterium cellulitidis TaxID=1768011 RepID=UPI000B940994|nr:phage tail tape measure protein [Sphingobacterium cellulitidis]